MKVPFGGADENSPEKDRATNLPASEQFEENPFDDILSKRSDYQNQHLFGSKAINSFIDATNTDSIIEKINRIAEEVDEDENGLPVVCEQADDEERGT
jgi:hypothetical protein